MTTETLQPNTTEEERFPSPEAFAELNARLAALEVENARLRQELRAQEAQQAVSENPSSDNAPGVFQETQAALRESERFARGTLNGLSAHIAILNENGEILAVNQAWRDFAAANAPVPPRAFEGTNYLQVCDGSAGHSADEAGSASHAIREVIAGTRERFELEYPCHSPAEQRWFNLRVSRFPDDGPARVVVAHEDITHRKQAEESLRLRAEELVRATEALMRANQELDQFAYITSHDLKAPLRGIANLAGWIEEDLGNNLTEETRHQLELLRGRVHRMEAMIEGILQYSRVGRVEVRTEAIDVAQLLEEVIDLLAPPDNVSIVIEDTMPLLRGERVRMQQVWMNLIGNAIKHNVNPTPHVWLGCREQGAFYAFSVRDDGPGIDAQYHERIFQIFQTLEARDKVEGTGIGLSLVKKIVEGQGGRVWVESHLEQGTAFTFIWPKQAMPTAAQ